MARNPEPPIATPDCTILLVGLNRSDRKRARNALEPAGYACVSSPNAAEALRGFGESRPALGIVSGREANLELLRETIPDLEIVRVRPGGERLESRNSTIPSPIDGPSLLGLVRRLLEPEQKGGIAGGLEHFPPAEIVQMVNLGRRSAHVTLTQHGRRADLWFDRGEVAGARLAHHLGEEAFLRAMSWERGDFRIAYGPCAAPDSACAIRGDTMYLVMEGLRRFDEARADRPPNEKPPALSIEPESPTEAPGHGTRRWVVSSLLALVLGAAGLLAWAPWSADAPPPVVAPVPRAAPILDEAAHFEDPSVNFLASWLTQAPREDSAPPAPQPSAPPPAKKIERAPRPEPAVAVASGSVDPLARPALTGILDPAAVSRPADPVLAAPTGTLSLVARSAVREGRLTLRVNETDVYSRELSNDRTFGKETFDVEIPVTPGRHTVTARVELPDEGIGYESSIELELAPGAIRRLDLTARRGGRRPLTLSAGDS